MRFGRAFAILVCCASIFAGCDRIEALKNDLLGSGKSDDGENPELAAVRNLYDAGELDTALERVAALTASNPNLADAHYLGGLCHLAKAGDAPDPNQPLGPEEQAAFDAFQRALSINPRYAPSAVGIGDLFSRRVPARKPRRAPEDPEDPYNMASDAYARAVSIDPTLALGQSHYAMFLEKTGQLEEAEKAYRAAIEAVATIPEEAPDYYMAYGQFLAGPANRLEEAIDQFELARMFRQDDEVIRTELAIIQSRIGQGHFEKQEYLLAEGALSKAYDLFPDKNVPEALKTAEVLNQLRSIRRR